MKFITKLLVTVMMTVFCCSIGKAQTISYTNSLVGPAITLIYSNGFDGSGSVNITNTQADYEAGVFGGASNTNWVDSLGPVDTNAFYANGTVGTMQGDSIVLPFTPQTNLVYTLVSTITFSANPGNWICPGFATNDTIIVGSSNDRWTLGGVDWGLITPSSSENVQAYCGPGTVTQFASMNGAFSNPLNTPHTMEMVLDTTTAENPSNKWSASCIMDGKTVTGVAAYPNGVFTYSSNPTTTRGVGVSQDSGVTPSYTWNSLLLFASQLALVEQPASQSVNQGSSMSFNVVAGGTPPFAYQWYTNGVALVNGSNISGATTNVLNISSALPFNAGTNYYCVVTNLYGAITSSAATLTVLTSPQFTTTDPISYTNVMTLFGGTNIDGTNYLGSTPTFSVATTGKQPITYFWLTNSAAVGGATNSSFTYTNTQWNSPTTFTCIASNSVGTVTYSWTAQYIPAPTAPFPQAIIADGAIGYWRLNETNYDPNQVNDGEVCNDYISGNNGVYTNTVLYQSPGYSTTTDPTETAAQFNGQYNGTEWCDANSIGTNVDFSSSSNAEFTVSIWANGGFNPPWEGLPSQNTTAEPLNGGIMVKGYYGTEEFALDDGAPNSCARFFVRTANNTQISASSTFQLGGNTNWNYLVGVCDESNGVISLYINGALAAQASIPPGSGLLPEAVAPITIAANPTAGTGSGNNVFAGALDDAAIFNYPVSPINIAHLYETAGGTLPVQFVPVLPPTNAVFEANTTLTIPATAFGTPPIGYYWTNLTTATVMASGVTNVLQNLNATLTIPNAPQSLSGDQLELVVTNAIGSTNWFVTLFSPPLPVTLNYSNSILYSNTFDGGQWTINGTALTAANSLVGGTNSVWVDALGTNDTGVMLASGVDESTEPDSWILPFTPEPGYVYTVTASLTFSGNPGNWVGTGFAQRVPTNAAVGYGRFSDGGTTPPDEGPEGYDWIILTESSGNVQAFGGPSGDNQIISQNGFFTAGTGTHTVQVVLDTTSAQWAMAAYVDGVEAGSGYTYSANPPIGAFGMTQNTLTALGEVQWNYLTLSQVAPGGVPPYLLAPLPSTSSITLTNSATVVAVNATAFGSAPMGYYWINNSTVVAAGVTNTPNPSTPNNAAPIPANLSITESSLSAGTLELVVTNAYGTNITSISLLSAVNPNPTNIMYAVTNNQLYLSWPADHTGWQLQAQTNSVGVGLSTNWADYNPSTGLSTATNQVAIPINLTNGTVFYRLIYTNAP